MVALQDWPNLVRSARDFCARQPEHLSVGKDMNCSARMKHIRLYVRRTDLRSQDSIFLNFDTAALYLSHLLEVHSEPLVTAFNRLIHSLGILGSESNVGSTLVPHPLIAHKFTVMLLKSY